MEPIDQNGYNAVDYRKEVLYVFDNSAEGGMARMAKTENKSSKFWQIISCVIGEYEQFRAQIEIFIDSSNPKSTISDILTIF